MPQEYHYTCQSVASANNRRSRVYRDGITLRTSFLCTNQSSQHYTRNVLFSGCASTLPPVSPSRAPNSTRLFSSQRRHTSTWLEKAPQDDSRRLCRRDHNGHGLEHNGNPQPREVSAFVTHVTHSVKSMKIDTPYYCSCPSRKHVGL